MANIPSIEAIKLLYSFSGSSYTSPSGRGFINKTLADKNPSLIQELLDAKLIKEGEYVIHKGYVMDQPFGVGCDVPEACKDLKRGQTEVELEDVTYSITTDLDALIKFLSERVEKYKGYDKVYLDKSYKSYGGGDGEIEITIKAKGRESDQDFLLRQIVAVLQQDHRYNTYLQYKKEFEGK